MSARAFHLEDARGHDAERTFSEATTKRPSDALNGREANLKYSRKGIELVPQPSDDPRDPLNWPMSKKIAIFGIMCFGTFIGTATAVSNVLAIPAQAEDFGITPEQSSYSISAVLGGIVVGPVVLVAAVRVFGVMSCCFWSEIAVVATSIWSSLSAGPGAFNSFCASRAIAGLFCPTTQVFSAGVIAQIFFLHQRGRAFAIYSTIYMVSSVAGPTFSAFIVQYHKWPICFWWTVAANGLSAILFFVLGEETGWDRARNQPPSSSPIPRTWLGRRCALFFPGTRVAAPGKAKNIKMSYSVFCKVFVSPICILSGIYNLINYGWFVMAGVQIPIILVAPRDQGGFGFSSNATGYFYFSAWIGALIGVGYGVLINDRLPLWIKKRRGGVWHPEYRLHTAWFPGLVVAPIGLGLFGASVFYHLHFMALAVAEAMIVFGATACIPPAINYVIEVYKSHPQEVGTALNVYRVSFTVAIQFFYAPWTLSVGVNWVWGISAFCTLFSCVLIAILVLGGKRLRKLGLLPDEAAEEEEAQERILNSGDVRVVAEKNEYE
ncbi:major facilitator superfamily domain-containing protein [Pestalotiopsis sp. NC0098]|nr:major facilitator superfamily domain-containing protein [Pestalotiopsis sp. NC0098]